MVAAWVHHYHRCYSSRHEGKLFALLESVLVALKDCSWFGVDQHGKENRLYETFSGSSEISCRDAAVTEQ